MAPIITLTTDFGLGDSYVGAMKGVILGINPDANLVDISHSVSPQSVREGAFVLGTAYHYYPEGAIHIAVVDPGVGTGRRALLMEGQGYHFVGPDNGIFSYVVADALEKGSSSHPSRPSTSKCESLPADFRAVELTRSRYWRPKVSATFHGRDIFAPVAAHLSLGVPVEEFGYPVSSILTLSRPTPTRSADGSLIGEVVHSDRFGNLITNIRAEGLPESAIEIEMGDYVVRGISSSYENGDGLLAIVGSSGYLEISEKNGSAAARTGAGVGTQVILRKLG